MITPKQVLGHSKLSSSHRFLRLIAIEQASSIWLVMSSASKFRTSLSNSDTVANGYVPKISNCRCLVYFYRREYAVSALSELYCTCSPVTAVRRIEEWSRSWGVERQHFLLLGIQGLYTYFEDEKEEECLS